MANFKDYTLEKVLGEGAFGRTYLARHTILGFKACLKLLQAPDYADLFREEAGLLAKVRHPYLPSLLGYWEDEHHVIALSFISGESLDKVVETGWVDDEHICWILDRILEALSYLHYRSKDPHYDRGIIHSDIKPANILLNTAQHEAYLVDFGLASTTATPKGGTEGYLPPEYAKGGTPTPASDLYSLGKTAIFLAGGRVEKGECPPDMNAGLREWIDALIPQNPKCRIQSADEARARLRDVRLRHFGRTSTPEEFKRRKPL